jgi:hypothetical protein
MNPAGQLEQGEVMTSAMHEAMDIFKAEHSLHMHSQRGNLT